MIYPRNVLGTLSRYVEAAWKWIQIFTILYVLYMAAAYFWIGVTR